LKGGEDFFASNNPTIVIEIANPTLEKFGYSSEMLKRYAIQDLGYKIKWLRFGKLIDVSIDEELPHERILGKNHGSNYLFTVKT
jgi:hypothetical protein